MNARTPVSALESASAQQIPILIPIEQLVQEAYAASTPDAQNLILARLVGKAFETTTVTEQVRLLERLMQSAGVLSLITVANGLFARLRYRAGWSHPSVRQSDLASIQSGDVIALAQHLLQLRADSLNALIPLLVHADGQSGSRIARTLTDLLRQRAPRRRASDRSEFGASGLHTSCAK